MNGIPAFDFQPTLQGNSISLRPLVAEDFESLYQAASDPLIWAQHPEPSRYQRDVFEQNFFKGAVVSGSAFVVVENATGNLVGSSRYYEWDAERAEVAIGYTFIARSHWGGATNREMKRLMLDHAFKWANVVWLHIGKDNWRSRKAAEKIGAVFTHEEIKVINGQSRETAFYKIDKPA
jgi:N-acetyltransferase